MSDIDELARCPECKRVMYAGGCGCRNAIIEECARVADGWLTYNSMAAEIAAAIRALKEDKP